ncbi:uncharacterized protein [Bemisia tabaci]|uniref:uncharacterized protein n=1 Tax=Bemisia tabaci TaxID=7038 RepID=UPI003B27FF31
MEQKKFESIFPAIASIFGGSFLTHKNDPFSEPDKREQILVTLLSCYLESELSKSGKEGPCSSSKCQLYAVSKLLKLWSGDLSAINKIRNHKSQDGRRKEARKMAQNLLKRIQNFENCTIIPSGLISASYCHKVMKDITGSHDQANIAILKKHSKNKHIDWIHVNPGSPYHQQCKSLAGENIKSFLEITDINPDDITEDFLFLLVGLKAIKPGEKFYYKEVSLYECLLVFLNGKTILQSYNDESFMPHSPISPVHTWLVIDQAFKYLLKHFIGDAYYAPYQTLITGFKISLVEKMLVSYRNQETQLAHFLLQEMCHELAQQALDHGSIEQKDFSRKLIDKIKVFTKDRCIRLTALASQGSQLHGLHILSLRFPMPCLTELAASSESLDLPSLKLEPVFLKPKNDDDIIVYLNHFTSGFVNQLIKSNDLVDVALLSYGIEVFFIDYLANTSILKTSDTSQFSSDDTLLAKMLLNLAKIFYNCQGQLISHLSCLQYQPHFFAKNVIIQFFVYASITALNLRDKVIKGPLTKYNLSVAVSDTVSLHEIIPHLVIPNESWLKVLFSTESFFMPKEDCETLFSHSKFQNSDFSFEIRNDAATEDIDVQFALSLLLKYPDSYSRFEKDHRHLCFEKYNRMWQKLAYTDVYLPSVYDSLSKAAHFAKVSLINAPSWNKYNCTGVEWHFINSSYFEEPQWVVNRTEFWRSIVKFKVDNITVSTKPNSNPLTSYSVKVGFTKSQCLYQRLIIQEENIFKAHNHFTEDGVSEDAEEEPINICHLPENEVIASQNLKPHSMDRNRYMQLGFLQSVPLLKIERLYIALKDLQLDICCEEDCVLIKQTLFEISALRKIGVGSCGLLQWTVEKNPSLIHQLGLLFIEKALVMRHRLTQHQALGNILEICVGLLTFYPIEFKDEFVECLVKIYYLLKEVLVQPPSHLSDSTLLHLNAYLVTSVQVKPALLETEMLTVLKTLFTIQNYKAKGLSLNNDVSLKMHVSSFKWCSSFQHHLEQNPILLNNLIANVNPQWDEKKTWHKSKFGLMFSCEEYSVKPLLGSIYFQNRPITGLPEGISKHRIFKAYLGQVNFSVMPDSQEVDGHVLPCFLSVSHEPKTRLTLIKDNLLIEEFIENSYQLYIPAEELLRKDAYPALFRESADGNHLFSHWLSSDRKLLFVKDQNRNVLYKWDLKTSFVYSLKQEGFIVPWKQLKDSTFKQWLQRVESFSWIEVIAQQAPSISAHITALHFPRLALHFYKKENKFYCKQIHGYSLAEKQSINSLDGFFHYFVLEKEERNSTALKIKVLIPHRKVEPGGYFYDKTVVASLNEVETPSYFVYEFDSKTGLLKCHHTRAQLYLALLYYCSSSLDDHDASNINAYHLSRKNLEACWKDEPFDNVELNIIAQYLNSGRMRDFHPNRIALYLKAVSLLTSSVRLSFLHTDKASLENKNKSDKLLKECDEYLPFLISQYVQHKSTIFSVIRLSREEEEEIMDRCPGLFEAYKQLYFKQKRWVDLSVESNKSYKDHYGKLFAKDSMVKTSFFQLFRSNISYFEFTLAEDGIDFSSGFNRILLSRFNLNNFIPLYRLAKYSLITVEKYQYLLHHMVLRAKINYELFPEKLVMMLARGLLLVAENSILFPDPPSWFGVNEDSVNLSNRYITERDVVSAFEGFYWNSRKNYENWEEEEAERRKAEADYEKENSKIWSNLRRFDLDKEGIPNKDLKNCQLCYESFVTFRDLSKQQAVRKLYLKAACNDSMFKFFEQVLSLCDQLKHGSAMSWSIASFIDSSLTVRLLAEKFTTFTAKPVSWEKLTIPQEPLITLRKYFVAEQQEAQKEEFLFEAQLKEPANEYQRQFCEELKKSWLIYHSETQSSYTWLNQQCSSTLEEALQMKHKQLSLEAVEIWEIIKEQLEQRPNSESDDYFALRWHSGKVNHYQKEDILRLLIEPEKLGAYNPDCIEKHDFIIKKLLQYVSLEIIVAKINRNLALLEQLKKCKSEDEQFSVLQSLVSSLEEQISPASFRHPHWLLFQYENEIIIRENQQELIEAMLKENRKTMYQLNMGEGKSSVILPLLCNDLANGRQVLRINVLSALLAIMKNSLHQCFKGLIKKRVYTLPFQRDTDISPANLKLILDVLKRCLKDQHILLVTPEFRLCLQLKLRELMLENQEQMQATGVFNWDTYRKRVPQKIEEYKDLEKSHVERLLRKQDASLRACLQAERYLNNEDTILKVPPRGQGAKKFVQYKETINDPTFREWGCLKAAYRELLYNSKLGYADSSEKLSLLYKIDELPAIDLLDESDEILKHGTELNYTIGDKFFFDGGELRWQIPQFFIQAIFCDHEVREIISRGKADGSTVLNVNYSPRGGVPFIQLLNKFYFENYIKPILIEKFFIKYASNLRKYNIRPDESVVKDEMYTLRQYIAAELLADAEKKVIAFLADKVCLKDKILIAKGWLSHGILFHVFNAKYRVQYGLNLHLPLEGHIKKLIAIPFFGKDAPSPRAEFSHPDVTLGFTITSYMYHGLNKQQLKESLMRLKDQFSHQVADSHLQNWAETSRAWIEPQTDSFPPRLLTSLKHLDLTDEQCLEKVYQFLSCNYLTISFYLSQFVFMQEAMQYLFKISANAHSLVGYNAALGFSGTDDRQLTMPFQIESLPAPAQEGTNGKLLSVLSEERNTSYFSLQAEDTNTLLEQLCHYVSGQLHCHALIDAGALVTGLTNYEAASFLLERLPANILGVLYFSDEGNSLTVMTRDGKKMPLQDCFLDKQNLFAYLDDIHTRGTDIKLPPNCHAILTVSMGMQKDKLMQAAMRLRQLAKKQSVSLWGTEATTLAIARDNSVDKAKINGPEVVKWVTQNTINHVNSDLFAVTVRKINFQFLKRAESWLKEAPEALRSLVKYCKGKELFSLEEFYAITPEDQDLADHLNCLVAVRIRAFYQEIEKELRIKQLHNSKLYKKVTNPLDKKFFRGELERICNEVAIYLQTGRVLNSLDNDEEKEVEVEIIEEQEFSINVEERTPCIEQDWDVRLILRSDFIGLAQQEGYIMPIRSVKQYIQMPPDMKNIFWHSDIYMSLNYIQSVQTNAQEWFDNYLRPVDIILIHRREGKIWLILLSGQEAAQIKAKCYQQLDHSNLLVHLHDINGKTQLPIGSSVSKKEVKLLTIVKLFAGECQFKSSDEMQCLSKFVGRLYPTCFTAPVLQIHDKVSEKLYESLIRMEYLDFSGTMTERLLKLLDLVESERSANFKLTDELQIYREHVLTKLYKIHQKLIVQSSSSMRGNLNTLREWVGTRGRLREYPGSSLESILNLEKEPSFLS